MTRLTTSRRAARLAPLALALAIAVPLGPVAAQQKEAPPPPGQPKGFTLPAKREITLPNGMGITLVPYGDVPKVDIELVTLTGNADEQNDQLWLADVMGQMMQQGTTTRTAQAIARAAADMGGSLDVDVQLDQTEIGGSVLSEFAARMVALVGDVVRHPTFPDSELARVKGNLARELAIQKSTPQAQALELFRAALYGDQRYGKVFPTEQMLEGYTTAQVRDFYAHQMGAARSHLYVVGRFDPAAVERAARQAFGDWAAGPPPSLPVPHPTSSRRVVIADRPKAVQSTIYVGLPVANPSSPDYVPLLVTDALLGGSFGSRITSNIREAKGYTYSPFSTVSTRYRDAYWVETADVTTNVTGPALTEIFKEIDRLRNEAPSSAELTGIQNYLAGTFVLRNSSRAGIINQLAFLRLHGLPDSYLTDFVQHVYAVTPAEVQRITREYLDPSRMTIAVVGDRSIIDQQLAPFGAAN